MSNQYSEDGFWDKVSTCSKAAGREVIKPSLQLYYTQTKEETPAWAKTLIYAALVYFIIPVDTIPDITPPPPAGYADDVVVMGTALATIAKYVTPAIKRKATMKLNEWFG